jgi:hypothetical protein
MGLFDFLKKKEKPIEKNENHNYFEMKKITILLAFILSNYHKMNYKLVQKDSMKI